MIEQLIAQLASEGFNREQIASYLEEFDSQEYQEAAQEIWDELNDA